MWICMKFLQKRARLPFNATGIVRTIKNRLSPPWNLSNHKNALPRSRNQASSLSNSSGRVSAINSRNSQTSGNGAATSFACEMPREINEIHKTAGSPSLRLSLRFRRGRGCGEKTRWLTLAPPPVCRAIVSRWSSRLERERELGHGASSSWWPPCNKWCY